MDCSEQVTHKNFLTSSVPIDILPTCYFTCFGWLSDRYKSQHQCINWICTTLWRMANLEQLMYSKSTVLLSAAGVALTTCSVAKMRNHKVKHVLWLYQTLHWRTKASRNQPLHHATEQTPTKREYTCEHRKLSVKLWVTLVCAPRYTK